MKTKRQPLPTGKVEFLKYSIVNNVLVIYLIPKCLNTAGSLRQNAALAYASCIKPSGLQGNAGLDICIHPVARSTRGE